MAAGVSFCIRRFYGILRGCQDRHLLLQRQIIVQRADRVGNAIGMRVPPRRVGETDIPQILQQNVTVGDGRMPGGLRDFTMMYLATL